MKNMKNDVTTHEVRDAILKLVNDQRGIRATDLISVFSDLISTDSDIQFEIYDLIRKGELIEIRYTLENDVVERSFIIPKNSTVKVVDHSIKEY